MINNLQVKEILEILDFPLPYLTEEKPIAREEKSLFIGTQRFCVTSQYQKLFFHSVWFQAAFQIIWD